MDSDCPEVDAICLSAAMGGTGTCVLSCMLGPKLKFLNDSIALDGKCNGRNDVRCAMVAMATYACLPTCGEDSQCPMGRVCDPRRSVCVDTPSTGKPQGSSCDPMAMTPECAGTCVSFTGTTATLCTENCELGGDPNDPTNTPNCGGPQKGVCAFSPSGNGAGDFGFCAPACSKQDDCQVPNFWCVSIQGLTGTGNITNGYCFGVPGCPAGAADCVLLSGSTCTDTKYGPQCLRGGFPLGTAAPDDGGTGDGGMTDGSTDGSMTDSGTTDSGTTDSGTTDGATDDGSTTDGAMDDGSTTDGATDDGGSSEAGPTDAGDGG
jgi:hypothetical protein